MLLLSSGEIVCAFSMITKIFTHILLLYPHGEKKKKSLPQESLWKNRVRESKQGEGTIILIYSKDYPMHIKTMV